MWSNNNFLWGHPMSLSTKLVGLLPSFQPHWNKTDAFDIFVKNVSMDNWTVKVLNVVAAV